ncbi:MAG TPA: hypothetical protein VHM92_13760, partial [Allosphingosinicella sp.]|nr:hypothetical protein [Allosphingosinicella sp.]
RRPRKPWACPTLRNTYDGAAWLAKASYDALNRMTAKDRPGSEPDVAYAYDLRGLQTAATFSASGEAVTNGYDDAGRLVSSGSSVGGTARTLSFEVDANGNRTRTIWPDAFFVTYEVDGLDRVGVIRENGGTALATFAYDPIGRRQSLTRGNGAVTTYAHDGASRLMKLAEEVGGSAFNGEVTFARNGAGGIASRTSSNDFYAPLLAPSGTATSTANGLNQIASLNGATLGYDAKGNMTSDPGRSFTYSSENLLTGANANGMTGLSLAYDPLMRLSKTGFGERLLYDPGSGSGAGYDRMVAEYNAYTGTPIARYAFGPGVDEPLVWYDLTGSSPVRRFLHADERGPIVLQGLLT